MKEILILDNHGDEQEKIVSTIRKVTEQAAIYNVSTEEEAYGRLMQREIDLFIVDVASDSNYYGDISGLKFIQSIRWIEKYRYTPIIILTNLEDPGHYTINELHCFGLLEKPVTMDLLRRLINEALDMPANKKLRKNICYKQDGIICALKYDDIIYIENRERLLLIHTVEEELLIKYETAKRFLKEVGDERFLQCNRQVIVNIDYIRKVDLVNSYIKLKNISEVVEIGRKMKRKVKDALECSSNNLWL